MSRKTKVINSSKFLNVITLLLERQEKLLQHINDLEEYVEILEGINDFDISKKKSGGIFFSKEEIYDLANKNKFSFIHNYSESSENYWVLFKAKKE